MKAIPPYVSFDHFSLCFIFSLKVVSSESWEALVSSCPDLKVTLTVDQVINTVRLASILQHEIPLVDFKMTAFYSPDEHWSAKPVFTNLLPMYRRSLQVRVPEQAQCSAKCMGY